MITSVKNKLVKQLKKLHKRKYREEAKRFLVEGYHLIEEAFKSGWEVEMVIVKEDVQPPDWIKNDDVTVVSEKVFKEISQTETPQGIAAVIVMKQLPVALKQHLLLVDAVQDPGNLGR